MTAQTLTLETIGNVYHGHRDWLLAWLEHKLGCSEKAADLAQDTFVRVLTRRDSLYLQEARALLKTIAQGLVVDHWRRCALEQAYLQTLANLPESESPSPEAQLIVLETLIEVDRLLDGLPEKIRRAFLWSQLDGLTYFEIAYRLEVSVSSVQQYMTRAFKACYAMMYSS